jgi:hypothetical protein
MIGADEVAPRFQRLQERVAGTAPQPTLRESAVRLLAAVAYLALMARLGTTAMSHWLLAALWVATPAARPALRRWLEDVLPFVLFPALYDALGLVRSAVAAGGVHTFFPYWLDKAAFGVGTGPARWSLNEVFAAHHWPALDLVAGFAYLLYIHAVLGFAVYAALVDRSPAGRRRVRAIGWTFLAMNLGSYVIYLLAPVAPPWYVAAHGFGPVDVHAAPSAAALVRWDALVGVHYFQRFYAQASDVFGAMPSMHCAYPMLLLLFSVELRRRALIVGLALFQIVMCFSAVYLQHHYVTDVLAGILFAVAAYELERVLTGRLRPPRRATLEARAA